MRSPARSAAAEWRAYWPVTFAAMLGYTALGLQSYGIGPFVPHLELEFGWSRAEVMLGLSLATGIGAVLTMFVGLAVDRLGPRRVGLAGLVLKTGGFALLTTATGSLLNWSLLWAFLAIGFAMVQSIVWTSVVAARFDRSRGLALAVVLTGVPITAAVAPLLATWMIGAYGWRSAFVGVGAVWFAVTFPPVLLLFRGPRDIGRAEPALPPAVAPGLTLKEGLRNPAFFRLLISFGTFSFYTTALAGNLVPMLAETGVSAMQAAGIASVMGIVGIIGRLSVGFLLDRLSAPVIGAVAQFLPVLGCSVFLLENPGVMALSLAVMTFGIAIGAEVDVAIYVSTRHFGLRAFATLFGAVITFGSINSAISPYVAGWMHDLTGSYDRLLMVMMVLMSIGAAAMLTIGRPRRDWDAAG